MNKFRAFLPITKVDQVNRLVYGTFTEEVPDRSREIFDYATSVPYFKAWSDGIKKSTESAGQETSLGNVRAMHDNVVAGKLTVLDFEDDTKKITGCAKVIDDNEWQKVIEGAYTGFSIGGDYVKRWTDPGNPALKRYTANPVEISLVDLPCVPTATFDLIKRALPEGAGENAEEVETVEKKVFQKVLKTGDDPSPSFEVDGDLEQVWKARNGETFAKKADAIKKNEELDAADAKALATATVSDLAKQATDAVNRLAASVAKRDGKGADLVPGTPVPESEQSDLQVTPLAEFLKAFDLKAKLKRSARPEEFEKLTPEAQKEWVTGDLQKGLYDVCEIVRILSSLDWIQDCLDWESKVEGDGSTLPGELGMIIDKVIVFLRALVVEETQEMMSGTGLDDILEMAAGPGDMAKAISLFEGLPPIEDGTPLQAVKDIAGIRANWCFKQLSSVEGVNAKLLRALWQIGKAVDPKVDFHLKKAHDHVAKMVNGLTCSKISGDPGGHFKNVKTAHDALCAMGAECGDSESGEEDLEDEADQGSGKTANKLAKAFEVLGLAPEALEELKKLPSLAAENAVMKEAFEKITPTVEKLIKRVEELEAQPLPAKGQQMVVSKTADIGNGGGEPGPGDEAAMRILSGMSQDQISQLMMKNALRNGKTWGG